MPKIDKGRLEAACKHLQAEARSFGEDNRLAEFLRFIPQPWMTTPAELTLLTAVMEEALAQVSAAKANVTAAMAAAALMEKAAMTTAA